MAAERKTLTQLSVPICLETLFYMLSGMVDTLMLSSVSDQAVGAVGTANTYIGVFIIMFGVISSGMIAVMSQNIGAGRPGIAYQARQLGLMFNAVMGILMSVILAVFGRSLNILIALIVFPHPDSPTSACILPFSRENDTSNNACLNPHSQLNPKLRFFTSNIAIIT